MQGGETPEDAEDGIPVPLEPEFRKLGSRAGPEAAKRADCSDHFRGGEEPDVSAGNDRQEENSTECDRKGETADLSSRVVDSHSAGPS